MPPDHNAALAAMTAAFTKHGDTTLDLPLVPAGRLTLNEAVEVYRNGYVARLTESLGETYETVWRVLGDDDFFTTCRAYIAAHRSLTHNLADYGADFAAHLATDPEAGGVFAFLPDLARFEWLFKTVFHTAPQHPADTNDLADPALLGGLQFSLGPAAHFFSSPHAVYRIWSHRHEESFADGTLETRGSTHLVLVKTTQKREIFAHELSAGAYHLLQQTAVLGSFARALDHCIERGLPLDESIVAEAISTIVGSGMFTGIQR